MEGIVRMQLEQRLANLAPACQRLAGRFYGYGWVDYEDYLQEALIGAWEGLLAHDGRNDVPPTAFALMCARRQIANAFVVASRHPAGLSLEEPVPGTEDLVRGDTLPARTSDPADVVAMRETTRQFLRSLTEVERKAVLLRAAGYSHREIARALGRGMKAVDNALQRARLKLEKRFS